MEIWMPVVGFEGFYEVSNLGQVRSIQRQNKKNKRLLGGGIVKPILGSRKYYVVNLTSPGKRAQYFLHRIVLEAFVGLRPDKYTCCHNDGDRLNCQLDNLRWDTMKSNANDRVIHGTQVYGANVGNSKLTDDAVAKIRKTKMRPFQVMAAYGISQTQSRRIVHGIGWSHVNVE